MNKNRKSSQDEPNRASNMEQAEGSRESVRGSGSSSERGSGSSSGMRRGSSDSGGISNRELSREECEQDQVPERGRSESDR
jgi:hypothetical protein